VVLAVEDGFQPLVFNGATAPLALSEGTKSYPFLMPVNRRQLLQGQTKRKVALWVHRRILSHVIGYGLPPFPSLNEHLPGD
jgi:hypothetical protein